MSAEACLTSRLFLRGLLFNRVPRTGPRWLPLVLWVGALCTHAQAVPAPTIQWNGSANGAWTDARNWTPSRVPNASDDVEISVSGADVSITTGVSVNSLHVLSAGGAPAHLTLKGSATLSTAAGVVLEASSLFDFQDGILGGPGDVAVSGTMNWSRGYLRTSATINPSATLVIQGGETRLTSGNNGAPATITNLGLVRWVSGYTYVYDGSRFVNSGTWRLEGSGQPFVYCCGGASGNFINHGTLVKTTATDPAVMAGLQFDNDGELRSESGVLVLRDSVLLHDGSHVTGPGQVSVSSGSLTLDGLTTLDGSLVLSGAEIGGTGTVTGPEPLHWQAGRLTGNLTIDDAGSLVFDGHETRIASGDSSHPAVLTNRGVTAWRQPGSYTYIYNGGQVINESVWNLETDGQLFYYCCGGARGSFVNRGTLSKIGGDGSSVLGDVNLDHSGTMNADVGTLDFDRHADLRANSRITGDQPVRFLAGEDVNIEGILQIQGNLELAGAVINGNGRLTGPVPVRWTRGRLHDHLTVEAGTTLYLGANEIRIASDDSSNPAVLDNKGVVESRDFGGYAYIYNGSQIVNEGTWRFGTDGQYFFYCCGGAQARFLNLGLLTKSGGTSESKLGDVFFEHRGQVSASVGELLITSGAVFRDGSRVGGSHPIRLVSGNTTFEGTVFLQGGPLRWEGANLFGTGRFSGPSPLVYRSGRLYGNITIGPGSVLQIEGGEHRLASDDSSNPATLTNQGLVRWVTAGAYFYVFNGSRFFNAGEWRVEGGGQELFYCCGGPRGAFSNTGTFTVDVAPDQIASIGDVDIDARGVFQLNHGTMALQTGQQLDSTAQVRMVLGPNPPLIALADGSKLGGSLKVSFAEGFDPSGATTFTLASGGLRSGTFSQTDLPATDGGDVWGLSYGLRSFAMERSEPCLATGVLGWWPGEGDASDITGTYPGTLRNGARFTNGVVGRAFYLPGNGADVFLGNWTPGTTWTLETWVNPDTVISGRRTILGAAADCLDWGLVAVDNHFGLNYRNPGGCGTVALGTNEIAPNTWVHLAGTCDGTTARFYLNGTLAASGPSQPNYVGTTAGVRIGSEACCGGTWAGAVDEPAVYERALRAEEILALYSNGARGRCAGFGLFVLQMTPTGVVTGEVSRISVRFNQPVQPSSFTAADVAIQTPQGLIPTGAIAVEPAGDPRTFTIVIPSQSLEGNYTVSVGPAILDLAGNPMTAGQAYTNTFRIDHTGPRVVSVGPASPALTRVDSIDVTFSEAIDPASFTAADLSSSTVALPSVAHIDPLGPASFRVRFSSPLQPGVYALSLGPSVSDLGGILMDQDEDGVPGEAGQDVYTWSLEVREADLAVTRVDAPASVPGGSATPVVVEFKNLGLAAAVGPWGNQLLLSASAAGDNPSVVGSFTFDGTLAPGASITVTQRVILPMSAAGVRYLGIQADVNSQVIESQRANDRLFRSQSVAVTAPDLAVTRFIAPPTTTLGRSSHVEWTVKNVGSAPAPAAVVDRLYLSRSSNSLVESVFVAEVPGQALAADDAYSRALDLVPPVQTFGADSQFYWLILADAQQQQDEATEANNTASSPTSLALPPLPDLVSVQVAAPASMAPGEPFQVSWAVTNRGNLGVNGAWVEVVQVKDSLNRLVPLVTLRVTNTLAPGDSLSRTQFVELPPTLLAGAARIAVTVDRDAEVLESDKSNNTATSAPMDVEATLSLSDSSITLDEGETHRVTLTRNTSPIEALTVTVSNSVPTGLTVPAQVVFPAGQSSVTLDLLGTLDGIPDTDQIVRLEFDADGHRPAFAGVVVHNIDLPTLTLSTADVAVREGLSLGATLRRTGDLSLPLHVTLQSSEPQRMLVPVSVDIPSGQSQVAFAMQSLDNILLEPAIAVTIVASSVGYVNGVAQFTILDDDRPQVDFVIDRLTLSESGGPQAAIGKLVRSGPTTRPLVLSLSSSQPDLVQVPAVISIAAGRSEFSFPIATVDDSLVNGTRSVTLKASFRQSGSATVIGEAASRVVQVTDDDGPALRLTLDRNVAREGIVQAVQGTVYRNTPTGAPLTVSLSNSDTTEAVVPATVTIPAGSATGTFFIGTIDDHQVDGSQPVTVEATLAGYAPSSASFVVTDVNLPDLTPLLITAPAQAETGGTLLATFRIVNQGFTAAPGPITTRLLLSSDPVVGGDTLLGQYTINDAMAVGVPVEQTVQVQMPQQAGSYWLVVVTDAGESVEEIREDNNTLVSATPVQVLAGYEATVVADTHQAAAGTPIPLHGSAVKRGGGPAAGVPVAVHVTVRGFRRVITATTDASGSFQTQFLPLPSEAGLYEVGAAHPGDPAAPVQDHFSLIGFKPIPDALSTVLSPGVPTRLDVDLENQSDVPITGVAASILYAPPGLILTLSNAVDTIGGFARGRVTLTVVTDSNPPAAATFAIRVTSTQGGEAVIPVSIGVLFPQARLVSVPSSLEARMRPGSQSSLQFQVINNGAAPSGPVLISLPEIPWMSLASTNLIPPLAPGESNSVTLLLTPAFDLDTGTFDGGIALNGAGAGFVLPFTIQSLRDTTGSVTLSVEDEFTFYAQGAPRVTNATVVIRNAATQEVVTNATTDVSGQVKVPALPEGDYQFEVNAPDHSVDREFFKVKPGTDNAVSAFISRDLVEYSWSVVPVEVEDRTRIVIETTFETVVPAPVVTVTPSVIDMDDIQGDSSQIDIVIQNHGLIAARDVTIAFDGHPSYTITPLVTELGTLAAQSSLVVPAIIRKTAAPPGAPSLAEIAPQATGTGPCGGSGRVQHKLRCGNRDNQYTTPITITHAGNCGPGGSGSGGGGGGGGGWGYGGGGASAGGNYGVGAYVAKRTYKPKDDCKCDPNASDAPLLQGCFEMGIGGPLASIAEGAANVLTKPINGGASLDLQGTVKFCTCCDEDGWGITKEGTIEIAGKVTAEIPLVGKTFKQTVEGVGESAEAEFGLGCSLKLEGALKGSVQGSSECHDKNAKLCYNFTAEVNGAAECSVGGKITTTINGVKETSGLRGYANVNSGYSAVFQGCDGQPATSKYCLKAVTAEIGLEAGVAGLKTNPKFTKELIPEECYPPPGPPSLEELLSDPSVAQDVTRQIQAAIDALVEGARQRFSKSGPKTPGVDPARKQGPQLASADDAICARVKIRLEQDLILTRQGFQATLDLINRDPANDLEHLSVELAVFDSNGHSATDLFGIRPPTLSNLAAVDGTGVLAANNSGTASFTLIPTRDAAPDHDVQYFVGGFFSYRLAGKEVVVPLVPVPITVRPDPRLVVQYFHERDVLADDPFTKDILEPSVPYSLAVLVSNKGKGDAKNVHIVSGQPQIVENDKGLAIQFKIIGTEVAGVGVTPSLTANFGEIKAGDLKSARWLMTSTLQGTFLDYKATFEHVDSLGKTNLSLIDEVTIHEMIRVVDADRTFADGKPDFLVNDVPDPEDMPDHLYMSDGSTNIVSAVRDAQVSGDVTSPEHTVQITVAGGNGWGYLKFPDPAGGRYELTRVERVDGSTVSVGTNVWLTDRTFLGNAKRPVYESVLHLLDYNLNGTYTLYYSERSVADSTPPTTQVLPIAALSGTSIPLLWEGGDEVGGSGLAYFDIYVSVNDGPFTPWLTHTEATGGVYTGAVGNRYAFYSIGTDRRGNREAAPSSPDAVTTVEARINLPPVIAPLTAATIDEGQELVVSVPASDPDALQSLTYSLGPTAPPGMTIDPGTGVIRWLTGEGNGPSVTEVAVKVRDNGFPPQSATGILRVTVREVNQAPILPPLPEVSAKEGLRLVVDLHAVDFDLPPQKLTYSLLTPPPGVQISPATGQITWVPSAFQGGRTTVLRVMVCDDGTPSLCATQTLSINVIDALPGVKLIGGRTNVVAGSAGQLPIRLESGAPLSDIAFQMELPETLLLEPSVQPVSPSIQSASISRVGPNLYSIVLQARPETPFDGALDLLRLGFNTSVNGGSASLSLPLRNPVVHTAADGGVIHADSAEGHVYLVAASPALEVTDAGDASGNVVFIVYGRPGVTYSIESRESLETGIWTPVLKLTLPAGAAKTRSAPITPVPGHRFFHAVESN